MVIDQQPMRISNKMKDNLILREDHGEYFSVSKARTLMENASKDEDLQNHIRNMEKYDIFVCITYISDGIHSGTCKRRHFVVFNMNIPETENVRGTLSGKKDCLEIIPITSSKTKADTDYQRYKVPIINRIGAKLSRYKELYLNFLEMYRAILTNKRGLTISRSEIIGYVGKLQVEDIHTIGTYRLKWLAEKGNKEDSKQEEKPKSKIKEYPKLDKLEKDTPTAWSVDD